jgi:hypothetical protein
MEHAAILVVFVLAFLAGAAALALWIDVRFRRFAPSDLRWAMAHVVAATVANEALDARLGGFVASSLPHGTLIAIFGVILPLVVYAALAAIWVLRIAHRALSGHLR